MADKEGAKKAVKELVKRFSEIPREELSKKPEEQIKFLFIEPLFEALGWPREDIEKEQRVLKGRADYILRLGNQEALVIEAKKANVELDEEEGKQAVSYAYHRKIKFAVLTNFGEIRVYHALSNIKSINKNLLKDDKGYFVLNSYEFEKEFDRLWLLSRESFEKGLINKLLSAKDERLSKPIDESILDDLLQYRDWLSKDLKKLRMHLSDEKIDEIVQILIDRLIFMRSVEDRGLEEKDFLLKIITDVEQGRTEKRLWSLLKDEFRIFDKTYNSKLFSEENLLEKEGFFDEDTLKKVIKGLYFGTRDNHERYMFDEIRGDLLGNIYEQYLGTVLRGSDKRVKLEEGTGKRKKMGIYYTPSYIVDYIVKNTVGEYAKGKPIDDILEIRILDPACGSGSFLIRAFQEVCDIIEKKLKAGERPKKWKSFQEYKGRLNLSQKIAVLTNCIFGVDLDEKAVELAQLNLLLRLLEDETRETKKRLLPNMKDNIKCGNSLIDDLSVSDKAFNWKAQFSDIFSRGGFDVVVGNPPYVRVDSLEEKDKVHWKKTFKSSQGKYDIYYLFIEGVFKWLKEKGNCGYITPNKFCAASSAKALREVILDNSSHCNIISVSHLDVFKDASNYPVILLLTKGNSVGKIDVEYVLKEDEFLKKKFDGYQLKEALDVLPYKIFPINITQKQFDLVMKLLKKNEKLTRYLKISEGLRIPPTLEDEKSNDFEILKQFQFDKWGPISRGAYISAVNLKKVVSPTSERYTNSLKDKIVIAEDALTITAVIDNEKRIPQGGVYFGVSIQNSFSLEYLLGLLNSKLISFVYNILFGGMHMGGGYLRYRTEFLEQLPIKIVPPAEQQPLISLVDKMLALQKKYHEEKTAGREKELMEQQIKQVDWEIDQEVYRIYGITEEEKRVIKESL